MAPNISHYCQKCLAANPLGQEFCSRCGTRLMIIVEPTSSRFETGTAAVSTDEHLLERISAAEARTARLAERLERSLDLLLRYAQNAYFDRSLTRALISLLEEDGIAQSGPCAGNGPSGFFRACQRRFSFNRRQANAGRDRQAATRR